MVWGQAMEVCVWQPQASGMWCWRLYNRVSFLQNTINRHPITPWWLHGTETLSALLALCEGNPPVTGDSTHKGPLMGSFDVSFDVSLTKSWTNSWEAGKWLVVSWCCCNVPVRVSFGSLLCVWNFDICSASVTTVLCSIMLYSIILQDCFLPKGSYAHPSSVMIILWSEICIDKFFVFE